ncbi:MAG TPA: peptide chain release factor H [Saprospiraceae bacterium]|nr:peptide chain release factor H [Saprospiraceae bacterium]HMT70332.1 peptide chain release factor H [Saprospiraceae bacterium]
MQKLIQITSGRGPAECTRVVARVLQILIDEARTQGLEIQVLQKIAGDENGTIETALLSIEGNQIFSFVASWVGTIQWIGESEIRKDHKRKNWYIGIFEVGNVADMEIKDGDISYQAMRSSGAGGQHVNKVSSAIRATHVPTGTQVVVMDSRSQHQNKKLAYERLLVKIREKHFQSLKTNEISQWKNQMQIERGNPVRVFHGSDFKRISEKKGYKSQRLKLKNELKNEFDR